MSLALWNDIAELCSEESNLSQENIQELNYSEPVNAEEIEWNILARY